ncbi:MAG: hypothetical protein QOD47_2026 [Gemmatimonadaceae bacterium]|jgi:hypothetical protein|nr:hypothetical protein [Gemmatimonadaceae bacterium]
MPEKQIYIYIGDSSFNLWNARRKRSKAPGSDDPLRCSPDARACRLFAEGEHLLRHNDTCDGDMISLEEPDAAMWESLREFIAAESAR